MTCSEARGGVMVTIQLASEGTGLNQQWFWMVADEIVR